MRCFLPLLLAIAPASLHAQHVVDSLGIRVTEKDSVCQFKEAAIDGVKDSLWVIDYNDTTHGASRWDSVSLTITGGPKATTHKAQDTVRYVFDSVQGKPLSVRAFVDGALHPICTVQMPKPSTSPTPDVTLYSGVEFTSADGFAKQQTRVPVESQFDVRLWDETKVAKPWSTPIWWRSTIAFSTEATSIVKAQTYHQCRLTQATYLNGAVPAPIQDNPCGGQMVTAKTGTDSTVLKRYSLFNDQSRTDTSAVTGGVWRSQGNVRLEFSVGQSKKVWIGGQGYFGVQTNPNSPSLLSTGILYGFGGTLDAYKILSLELGTEATEVFPVDIQSIRSIADTTPTTVTNRLKTITTRGLRLKVWIMPLKGYYVRGVAQFNDRGLADYASIAFVKSVDIGKIISGILSSGSGGSSTSPSP